MKRLFVIVLTLLVLVGTAYAPPPTGITSADKRYPIQVCTEQTGRQHGECWWVQGFPVGSGGLGRTARIQAVSAALYAWSVANQAPIRIEIGAGTAAAALRVTMSSNSPTIALLEAIRDAVQIIDNIVETDRAAVNPIVGQIGIAAGSGVVGPTTTRVAPATDVRFQVSDDANSNAVANPIWTQLSQDGATAVGAANPIPISKDMAANATGNRIWMVTRVEDGDSAVLQDVLGAFADNQPLTLNGAMVLAVRGNYDGALIDMARNNATGADLVGVESWHCAYDDSGCNVKVNVDDRTPVYGVPETSGTIVGAPVVVCTARDVSTDDKGCFYLKNEGGAGGGPFTAATWSTSPDNVDYTPATDLGASCNVMASGVSCVFCWDDSYRWIRISVTAAAAANDTTAKCTYVGQN